MIDHEESNDIPDTVDPLTGQRVLALEAARTAPPLLAPARRSEAV